MKFSALALARNALSRHRRWPRQWRSPEARKVAYDANIVGAGGHGLATAYYLAKEHALTNIAVLDKAWLGGVNTGSNTTIIRSHYLFAASSSLYDHALKLWETLGGEFNYNVMFSPRSASCANTACCVPAHGRPSRAYLRRADAAVPR